MLYFRTALPLKLNLLSCIGHLGVHVCRAVAISAEIERAIRRPRIVHPRHLLERLSLPLAFPVLIRCDQ